MKHSILTRINFTDLTLLDQYLKVTKKVLIPALKSQTNKNFDLIVITNPEIVDLLRSELDYPFTAVYGNGRCYSYLLDNKINIQTRHDCDDYMSPDYVQKIQETYLITHKKYDKFIIQAQPTQLIYQTGEETSLKLYSSRRCSMFLSLCQTNVTNHVLERKHLQMYEIASHVITLPTGYTKWLIHGKNQSLLKKK